MAISPGSAVAWVINYIKSASPSSWSSYTNPADTEEDSEYETTYVTQIRYQGSKRNTKYILVNEMPDYFPDEALNEGYHTKEDYVQANDRYGYIFKHQKFDNADTVDKLEEYATDWIKNNYHGGLTSFEITALDMHLMGEDVDPYMVGDQIDVYYPDPDTQSEVQRTLTCISAEYDLYNPEKTKYKIGIPDSTLSKVYGESSSSGSGGGGGSNSEEENDEESNTEAETTENRLQKWIEYLEENGWSFMSKWLPGGEDGTETSDPNLATPKSRDETNAWNMSLTSDNLVSGSLKSTMAEFLTRMTTKYAGILNDLNVGNDTKIGNDLNVENELTVKEKATTKDLEASGTVKGKDGEFDTLKIDNKSVKVGTSGGHPTITINGQTYVLETIQ